MAENERQHNRIEEHGRSDWIKLTQLRRLKKLNGRENR